MLEFWGSTIHCFWVFFYYFSPRIAVAVFTHTLLVVAAIVLDGRRHGKALILVNPLVDQPKSQLKAEKMEVKSETQVSKKRRLE